jgi:dTDP-4-amino-4,6-dideoxygalactose transaminase
MGNEDINPRRFIPPSFPLGGYLAHKEEIHAAIARTLASGSYVLGTEVATFEQDFAAYLGVRHAVGVGSGTDALAIALRACQIGPGDTVITVSHTAVATVAAIELTGARPILVDIDPRSYTIDPNRIEDVIKNHGTGHGSTDSARLKAIIPVHLYGAAADMPAILDLARIHNLYVIEDCAQAHGATTHGRKTGTWGDLGAFSFYPTKNLAAFGDGGAVVTSDAELASRARRVREYGWQDRYVSESAGMNSRLDEIQAAVLRVKLNYLDEENARRRRIAAIYDARLTDASLILPRSIHDGEHVYHQYVVRSRQRDDLKEYLNENSIGTLIHYPLPVHLQPAYRDRVMIGPAGLRNTEEACSQILSLPMHPQMSDDDAIQVCDRILSWQKREGR